jgi:U3 small nucleolar RNA-associated protein 23
MKVLRQKQVRKTLRFFALAYGLRPPYKVLLDGSFMHAACKSHIALHDLLEKLLMADVKLCTTHFVVRELKALGPAVDAALQKSKNVMKLNLGRAYENLSVLDGFKRLLSVDNQARYIVCTQDPELRAELRKIPGTPIMYLNRAVLVLEPPSTASKAKHRKLEAKKNAPRKEERRAIHAVHDKAAREKKNKEQLAAIAAEGLTLTEVSSGSSATDGAFMGNGGLPAAAADGPKRKKRKGPSGPNPLSQKKKKKKKEVAPRLQASGKKKNRRRSRKKAK